MVLSFLVAIYFQFVHTTAGFEPLASWMQLVIGVGITSLGWIVVTYLSPATSQQVLIAFIQKVNPGGPGWKRIIQKNPDVLSNRDQYWSLPVGILAMLLGAVLVYLVVRGTGLLIYGQLLTGVLFMIIACIGGFWLMKLWDRLIR
jgi:SSS family solute:Na+ symporter